MSLATNSGDDLSVCSLFYVYDVSQNIFIVASSESTKHIEHIKQKSGVAGNILLETKMCAKFKPVTKLNETLIFNIFNSFANISIQSLFTDVR